MEGRGGLVNGYCHPQDQLPSRRYIADTPGDSYTFAGELGNAEVPRVGTEYYRLVAQSTLQENQIPECYSRNNYRAMLCLN